MRPIPEHGVCFVCGTENPRSMGVHWFVEEADGSIHTDFAFTLSQQGPPDLAHGGATSALLDEAMGIAIWYAGHTVAAVNLNVDFHLPVPLEAPLHTRAWIAGLEKDGKVVKAEGELRLPDGQVAVSSRGVYVEAPQLFEKYSGPRRKKD